MKGNNHGGARKGAGRKPKYPTKVMRVPEALVKKVKNMIRKYNDLYRKSNGQ